MFRKPARQIRNLHAARPALSYVAAVAIWLLTTLILLYFVRIFLLTESLAGHLAVSVFGMGVLAIHSAMSLFLGDAWKVHFRKLDRENVFISFLGRFE